MLVRLGVALGLAVTACGGRVPAQPTGAPVPAAGAAATFDCGPKQCANSNFCMEYEVADGGVAHECRPTPDGCPAPATCDCIAQQGWKLMMCADDGGTHSVAILAAPP